ncbi:MAG TPA: phosphomannomutase/phosphoglucomutase [Thermoanaerobaculia bacterium]|nr:phosphomannomutase/phosphoglucomutase [Thermoanaerobaculia bacterium]
MAGIFKAYDIRGVYGADLDETTARQVGLAFQHVLDDDDLAKSNAVVVGRDMRSHSAGLAEALIDGLTAAGLDVLDVGLVTTPMNYFAVGHLGAAGGIQVTASHNPAKYNGFKLSRHGARPVSGDHGIALVEEKIAAGDLPEADARGEVTSVDVNDDYQSHVLGHLRSTNGGGRLRLVADAANGMGTLYRPLLEAMGIDLVPLYFELDGSFPNHEANPLKEENLEDLQEAVERHGADLGVSFDGDADRSAFVDETGRSIGSDLTTALIAGELLERHPGAAVVYDLRSSRALAEYVREKGGVPIRERVGHSFMKATLREHEGVFGGELAGHYYFRDNFYADSSILAVVEILNLMRKTHKPLSELVEPLRRYAKSPEINFEVEDKQGKMDELARRHEGADADWVDGISVRYPTWWFNVRPSNTEPYLRLVVEAKDEEELERRLGDLMEVLGEPAAD